MHIYDHRNFMGIIIDCDNNMYQIAVRAGMLKRKYSRNQFDLCVLKLLQVHVTDVSTDQEDALRTAVQMQSLCSRQGFIKCNYAGSVRCNL